MVVVMGAINVCRMRRLDRRCCAGSPQFGLTHDLEVETNTYTAMAWVKPNGTQPEYTGIILGGESAGTNFRPNNEPPPPARGSLVVEQWTNSAC